MTRAARVASTPFSRGMLCFRTVAAVSPTRETLQRRFKTADGTHPPEEAPQQVDATCPLTSQTSQTSIEHQGPASTEHDVFHCTSVDAAAVRMRRRVQLGIFLEVSGTQLGNVMFHNADTFWNDSATCYFENSAALLAAHVGLMWWYHAFLRDALLARHVTRIALCRPPAVGGDSEPVVTPGGGTDSETLAVLVETGPWTRRLELSSPPRTSDGKNAVTVPGQKVSLGQVLRLGVLHVDRSRGDVLDHAALSRLVDEDFLVTHEEITTDVARLEAAYVHADRMIPFLHEAGAQDSSGSSFLERLGRNAWLNRAFQLPGGQTMDGFGLVALVMGLGSVVVLTKWRH